MIELSRNGRIYAPERSYECSRRSNHYKSTEDWWLGVLLFVILGVCPILGLFVV